MSRQSQLPVSSARSTLNPADLDTELSQDERSSTEHTQLAPLFLSPFSTSLSCGSISHKVRIRSHSGDPCTLKHEGEPVIRLHRTGNGGTVAFMHPGCAYDVMSIVTKVNRLTGRNYSDFQFRIQPILLRYGCSADPLIDDLKAMSTVVEIDRGTMVTQGSSDPHDTSWRFERDSSEGSHISLNPGTTWTETQIQDYFLPDHPGVFTIAPTMQGTTKGSSRLGWKWLNRTQDEHSINDAIDIIANPSRPTFSLPFITNFSEYRMR
ncbi:hypothetical protein BCR39DRAFT_523760 [Naematelia encephala]|uniref:Uncharacterized protein n=1 Tax=Naematelia encephala TaxID=71784 RepID=A0A1Y2BDY7_9TREE|nr:hypothetical protein BCR39DRAFT_523760 [Naematelia encephala]